MASLHRQSVAESGNDPLAFNARRRSFNKHADANNQTTQNDQIKNTPRGCAVACRHLDLTRTLMRRTIQIAQINLRVQDRANAFKIKLTHTMWMLKNLLFFFRGRFGFVVVKLIIRGRAAYVAASMSAASREILVRSAIYVLGRMMPLLSPLRLRLLLSSAPNAVSSFAFARPSFRLFLWRCHSPNLSHNCVLSLSLVKHVSTDHAWTILTHVARLPDFTSCISRLLNCGVLPISHTLTNDANNNRESTTYVCTILEHTAETRIANHHGFHSEKNRLAHPRTCELTQECLTPML